MASKRITADMLRDALASTSTPGAAAKRLGIKVADMAAMLELDGTREEFIAATKVARVQSRVRVIDQMAANVDTMVGLAGCDDPRRSIAFAATKELISMAERFIAQDLDAAGRDDDGWEMPEFPATRQVLEE